MHNDRFEDLSLSKPILQALNKEGYVKPTPIQKAAIPALLEGRDLLASAQTGTGKTAAFAVPILELLAEDPDSTGLRAVVLTPTRELALQVDESFRAYGRYLKMRTAVVLGGVAYGPQIAALKKNPDILVATPGRLLDLMQQGYVSFEKVEMFVLDEADRMLDMGFIYDVRRITDRLPRERQTMFFSATLPPEVASLASDMLWEPARVAVAPPASVPEEMIQRALFVSRGDKLDLLTALLGLQKIERALVFTRTKHRADRVVDHLMRKGVKADAIHSNKTQKARQRALAAFDTGKTRVLVATDIVARGIDVEGITHVINYEMPNDAEGYVHRIGRTARAGARGMALSFCDVEEVALLKNIESLTGYPIEKVSRHRFHSNAIATLYGVDDQAAGGCAETASPFRTRPKLQPPSEASRPVGCRETRQAPSKSLPNETQTPIDSGSRTRRFRWFSSPPVWPSPDRIHPGSGR